MIRILPWRVIWLSLLCIAMTACAPAPRVYIAPYDRQQLATVIPELPVDTRPPMALAYYSFLRPPANQKQSPLPKNACDSTSLSPEGTILKMEQLERVLDIELGLTGFVPARTDRQATVLIQARTECTVQVRTTLEYPPNIGWGGVHRPGLWYGPHPYGGLGYYRYPGTPSFPIERQYRVYIHRLSIHFYEAPSSTKIPQEARFPGPLIWHGQAQLESLHADESVSWPALTKAILDQYPAKSIPPK